MNGKKDNPVSPAKCRARRLRIAGIIALVLGIAGAGMVYWMGTRPGDLSNDPSMAGHGKPEERQMAILYGKPGELIEGWSNDLKQPGTQAIIILVTSALIAGGSFYFARLLDYDDETSAGNDMPGA